MRKTHIIVILISCFINSTAQDTKKLFITDVFIQLPIDTFSVTTKKELLKNRHSEDKNNKIVTDICIDSNKNSLYFQTCMLEGMMTSPCDNYYIKTYKINNNSCKIIYSKSTHSFAENHQGVLNVYRYDFKTKILEKDSTDHIAFKIKIKDFFKENTPDSVLLKYKESIEPIYSFVGDTVYCRISDKGYANILLDEPWLKGNQIEICWLGGDFVQCNITKEMSDKERETIENE